MGADYSLQISLRSNRAGDEDSPDSGAKYSVRGGIADRQIHSLHRRIVHDVIGDRQAVGLQQRAKGFRSEVVQVMARVETMEDERNSQYSTVPPQSIKNARLVGRIDDRRAARLRKLAHTACKRHAIRHMLNDRERNHDVEAFADVESENVPLQEADRLILVR
jgi:hypothetical protein